MTIAEQSNTTAQQSTDSPYEGVGRQAWILLWIAFGIFVILLLGIPLTLNWYLHAATDPLPARVEGIRGTTLVVKPDSEEATAVIEIKDIQEGDIIRTDDTARANVSIFVIDAPNDSLATVQLRGNSDLVFERARTARYGMSDSPDYADLQLNVGRARVTASADNGKVLNITITTPHSVVRLHDGSAAISVTNDSTEVNARSGEVEVIAQGRMVVLTAGRRSTTLAGSTAGESRSQFQKPDHQRRFRATPRCRLGNRGKG